MTKKESISLLSLADEKYVLEANPINAKTSSVNAKWKKLSLIAASILLSIIAVTSSLVFLFSNKPDTGGKVDGNISPPLEYVYPLNENSSMALVELQSIGETYYAYNLPGENNNCIMVKFKIIEDYYNNLPKDMVINVPIELPRLKENAKINQINNKIQDNSTTQELSEIQRISAEKAKEFLNEYKYAIIYIHNLQENDDFLNGNGETVKIKTVSSVLSMDECFIPLENDIVSVGKVENFYLENECVYSFPNKYVYGYSRFVHDGMSLETFKENIRALYQQQVNGISNMPTSNDMVDY